MEKIRLWIDDIRIHTMNTVGYVNMKAIYQKNNWRYL